MLCRVLISFPVSILFLQVLPSSPPAVERKSLKGREEKSDASPRQPEVRDLDDEVAVISSSSSAPKVCVCLCCSVCVCV